MISQIIFHDEHNHYMSLIFSLVFYFTASFLLEKRNISRSIKSPFVISGYLLLLSIQYLLISLFPQLDSHVSIGVFGNMVTATFADNVIMTSIFIAATLFYFIFRRAINRETFEASVLDNKAKKNGQYLLSFQFLWLSACSGSVFSIH